MYSAHKVSCLLAQYPHYPWCTVYTCCLAHSLTIPLFLVYTVLNVSCPLTQYPKYPWSTVYTRCLSHSPTIPSIPSVRCIQGGLPTHPLSPLSLMYSVHKGSCLLIHSPFIPSVQCTQGVLPTHSIYLLYLVYGIKKVSTQPISPICLVHSVHKVSCPLTHYPPYP